jgi:RHS repeat-associated protein
MDSTLARFHAPDPIGPVDSKTGKINDKILTQPQRLNAYAYALNNPGRYVDPSGLSIQIMGDVDDRQYTLQELGRFVRGDLSIDQDGMLSRSPCNKDESIESGIDKLIASDHSYRIFDHLYSGGTGRAHTKLRSS